MKSNPEDNIVWEGVHFYVYRVNATRFEVRKHNGSHALVVGWGADKDQVIRTAVRLERYPEKVR